jgi:hypothetical protein
MSVREGIGERFTEIVTNIEEICVGFSLENRRTDGTARLVLASSSCYSRGYEL